MNKSLKKVRFSWKVVVAILFLGDVLWGVFTAKNVGAGFYGLTRLLEWVFVGYYIASFPWTKKNVVILNRIVICQVMFLSVLSMTQFFLQHSLNGILYFFGERNFSLHTPGIADASIAGRLVLRPYGTFPHPNVLAGYLVIVLTYLLWYFLWFLLPQKKSSGRFNLFLFFSVICLGSFALCLTLSRVALVVWGLIVLFFFSQQSFLQSVSRKKKIVSVIVLIMILLLSPLRYRFFDPATYTEAFFIRLDLTQASLHLIADHVLTGVGLFNFLPNLSTYLHVQSFSLLQPVHNVFLLVFSETGGIGFFCFILFLYKTCRHILSIALPYRVLLLVLFCTPLVIGLTDHYFLTLEQGEFLFALCFGFCWSSLPVALSGERVFLSRLAKKTNKKIVKKS